MSEAARQIPEKEIARQNHRHSRRKRTAGAQCNLAACALHCCRAAPHASGRAIEILYCGVCHFRLHQVRNEWQSVHADNLSCVPATRSSDAWSKSAERQEIQEGRPRRSRCMVTLCRVLRKLSRRRRAVL